VALLATLLGLHPVMVLAAGSSTPGEAAAAQFVFPRAPGLDVAAPMISLDGVALKDAAPAVDPVGPVARPASAATPSAQSDAGSAPALTAGAGTAKIEAAKAAVLAGANAATDAAAGAQARPAEPTLGVPVLVDSTVDGSPFNPEDRDLWSRIRRGFKMPDLTNKRAQSSTRWYAAQPDYIARMTTRASMYLYHIVDEIEKRGMPTELALLPFVESGMQPEAVSWAHAAGLWQFIPSTGKDYALEQNLWMDERFGVIESTRAALDYLQKLYTEFGDWQLALAAYNCGEAGVERALARARAAHRSVAYSDLRLPNETLYYVPKLQAIKNIVADPQRFGISLPAIANEPYFVAFNKLLDIDVATAARLADMSIDEFRALNPAFSRPLILGASSPTILVPADKADAFEANLAAWQSTGQPLASWTAYALQPGETLAKVAERVGLSEAQLRVANHIPARYRPAAGSTLLIPRDEGMSEDIAPGFVQASFALVPEFSNQHQVTYRVRRGDTLASVARRWHVSADDIVSWNQLSTMALFTGQRLTLTVTRAAAPVNVVHRTTKKAKAGAAPPAKATTAAADASHAATRAAAAAAVPSRM
jgi:membrane-bound lytic murein transglycosylase D